MVLEEVIMQISIGKSRGPDWFTFDLFHPFCDLVKAEVPKLDGDS